MIRTRRVAAAVLGAVLVTGACTAASAQSSQAPTQEQFDREKATLKDRTQESIASANESIDVLKRMSDSDKGTAKKRDDDLARSLSDQRDHLAGDLDKMAKATPPDWPSVRPVVMHDLAAMKSELKRASTVTHVPGSATEQR
jgi:hypothetical protein